MTTIQTTDIPRQLTLFDLEQLETRVRTGLAAFIDTGTALMEIQQREGFRLKGYESMESYCEAEFGFSLRHGQRLIQAAQVAQKVEQITGVAPRNEAAAREIGRVAYSPQADKLLPKVEKELGRQGKSIATATAEVIAKVVERVVSPKKPASEQQQQQLVEEMPEEPPALASTLTDFCPSCGSIPESYTHRNDGWHCSDCDAPVTIGVIATK